MVIKKILSVVVLSVISVVNSYSMSTGQAVNIYSRLVSIVGLGAAPMLRFSSSKVANAYYEGQYITVNIGMLNSVRNSNELAMVLGHELAHSTLHHNGSTPSREYAADALGARYVAAAGYNVCSGAKWFLRQSYINSHPPSVLRYKALGCH